MATEHSSLVDGIEKELRDRIAGAIAKVQVEACRNIRDEICEQARQMGIVINLTESHRIGNEIECSVSFNIPKF